MPIWFYVLAAALIVCVGLMCWWARPSQGTKCRQCKGLKKIYDKERIPRSELSPMEHAELMVNGGYAYKLVPRPCPVCSPEEAA
jgi:hypothetical protein